MRVGLFIHYSLAPMAAGIGKGVRHLVREMAGLYPEIEFQLICFKGQARRKPENLPANTCLVEIPFSARTMVHGLWQPFGWPPVERWTGPLDVLHLTDTDFRVPTRSPLVVTINDLFPERFPNRFKRRARLRRRGALQQARGQAMRVIAISETTRQDVIRLLGIEAVRVKRIYYGAPREYQQEPTPSEMEATMRRYKLRTPFFLFVGRQDLRKNLGTLLHAFARFRRTTNPGMLLVLAGSSGWRHHELHRQAKELGISASVRFTGYLLEDELRCLFHAAQALLYPSHWEGFGFPPLEAMSAGLPVIASTGGSIPEVVGSAALLHTPEDVESLARAMTALTTDEVLRHHLVRQGREQLRRYSWAKAARLTVKTYRTAARSKECGGARAAGNLADDSLQGSNVA